jgi:hypothetical protein
MNAALARCTLKVQRRQCWQFPAIPFQVPQGTNEHVHPQKGIAFHLRLTALSTPTHLLNLR